MKIEVHILCCNEAPILNYALRHYLSFAQRVVVHDAFSEDGSRVLVKKYGADLVDWDTGGKFDDIQNMTLKNECWKGTDADWVIVADVDELIYFPGGVAATLAAYDQKNLPIILPYGWEMCSEVFPTTMGQIYEEVKHAARDDHWYGKPILFAPKRIRSLGLGIGAHDCYLVTNEGTLHRARDVERTKPVTWLLHCKHLGPIERIGQLYDLRRTKLSENNVQRRWGNFDPGMKHAHDKRAFIMSHLERIFD